MGTPHWGETTSWLRQVRTRLCVLSYFFDYVLALIRTYTYTYIYTYIYTYTHTHMQLAYKYGGLQKTELFTLQDLLAGKQRLVSQSQYWLAKVIKPYNSLMSTSMAHRVLQRYPRTMVNRFQEVAQKFEYLLVMDFEATCDKHENPQFKPQEIIELPCIALSTSDWKTKDTFHAYIRPRLHSTLTPFCIELTGIMQEMVDNQPYFPDVFSKFYKWLREGGYFDEADKSAFVTSGNWDLKIMLPSQCNLDNIMLPDEFKRWIELKHTFCESTGYYPRSLKDMLVRLNVPFQGRLHSGIDDVKNMVSIIQALKEKYNTQFKFTSSLTSSALGLNNPERNKEIRTT